LRELRSFLAGAGVQESAYDLEDGSGLSRLDLVTPSGTAQLLRYMYLSEDRDGWLETLAVGGGDGTLQHRFSGSPGRVRAKTGTMTHVSALSGYVDSPSRGTLAFSILVNNYTASDAAVRSFIDRVVATVLQ
jgi:D-alanyl-D-alanine carboxypeptidase/D-alanyl-D-alanine-endopeptidase (penicillin-binding protein 4)